VALGAAVIEKHFTLSRNDKTADSFFSIEPHELKDLIDNIRIAEKAIGKVHYGLTEEEKKIAIFRRSLFVVKDVKAGEKVSNENIRSIRPGCGLPTKYIEKVIGRTFKKDLSKGTPLNWDLI
jgi:N-acetylneuraminate synthase